MATGCSAAQLEFQASRKVAGEGGKLSGGVALLREAAARPDASAGGPLQ